MAGKTFSGFDIAAAAAAAATILMQIYVVKLSFLETMTPKYLKLFTSSSRSPFL